MSLKYYPSKGALFVLAHIFCVFIIQLFSQQLVAQIPHFALSGNIIPDSPDRQDLLREHFTNYQLVRLNEASLAREALPDQFHLLLDLGSGRQDVLNLGKNSMRSPDYQVTANTMSGVESLSSPRVWTYKGTIDGQSETRVRLSLYPGAITGFIRSEQDVRFIEPLRNLDQSAASDIYITYSNSDIVSTGEPFCMAELVEERGAMLNQNGSLLNEDREDQGLEPWQNPILFMDSVDGSARFSGSSPTVTTPEGMNISAGDIVASCSILELATEADFEWFQFYGSSVPASIAAINALMNQVEGLYCSDLNVRFFLTNQNVQTLAVDPYTSGTLLDRLMEFRSLWSTTAPYNGFPRDLAHMFTGTNLPGSAVGYAYVGVVCSFGVGYGITQRYNSGIFGQVVVLAHEMGHNFSAPHSTSVSCGSLGSVMCPYVQSNSFYFSPATIAQINGHIASRNCMAPPDLSISPVTATLCSSPTVNFVATFNAGYTYQWYRDSVAIPGATSNSHLDSIPGTYIVDIFDYDTTCGTCTVSLVATLSGRTVVVTNTNDIGLGSLRDAITNANACIGKDTILFDIPGTGPHTISPLSPLPAITDTVFINGYSQPGAVEATASSDAVLMIEVAGGSAGNTSGLHVQNTPDCKISGLCLNTWLGFGGGNGAGILLQNANRAEVVGNYIGTDPTGSFAGFNRQAGIIVSGNSLDVLIGGDSPGDLNLISGNENAGIQISGDSGIVRRTIIQGNFIGTDISGTMRISNFYGITVNNGDSTLIGGLGPEDGNLISGNSFFGIEFGSTGVNSVVEGNLIGTDAAGLSGLGNGSAAFTFPSGAGIHVQGGPNRIGGFNVVGGNTISGNSRGILIEPSFGSQQSALPVSGIDILGNRIGVDVNGVMPLGNFATGVMFVHDPGFGIVVPAGGVLKENFVGGFFPPHANVIAYNGNATLGTQAYDSAGVAIRSSFTPTNVRGNTRILQNRIYFSGGLGIYIAPNSLINPPEYKAPVLISAVRDCPTNTTTINGELQANDPNTSYRIEYFFNFSPDPSGTGEGENFLGSGFVVTDGSGNASFSHPFPATQIPTGTCISSTATALDTGNTSVFSNNVCITLDPLVFTPQSDINVCEGSTAFLVDFDPAINVTYTIPTFGTVTSDTLFYPNPVVGSQIYILLVDTCGRVGFDTVNVNVNPLPLVELGGDTIICLGDTLLLDAGAGLNNYVWQDFSNLQTYEVTLNGEYHVRVSDSNFCFNRDTINVLFDGPLVDLGADTTFCSGGILDAGFLEGGSYGWNVGGTDQYLLVDSAGTYDVILTDSNGCTTRDTININLDSVYVNLGNDTIYTSGDSLFAGNGGCSYSWSTGETTQSIFPPAPGAYQVTVTCPSGCAFVDEVILSSPPFDLESVTLTAYANKGAGIHLDWSCLPDACRGSFTLERGGATEDFFEIGSGLLESVTPVYLDAEPLRGWNRYRVRVEDLSGQVARSNIAWAYWEGEAWIKVSPVPVGDYFQLDWFLPEMERGMARAFDALGREIWRGQLKESEGSLRVACSRWAKGLYILRIEGGENEGAREIKMVKK